MSSWDSTDWLQYDCVRIFTASEHFFPFTLFSDINITNKMFSKNELYYNSEIPWNIGLEEFIKGKKKDFIVSKDTPKTEFANFIYSNKNAKKRNVFLDKMFKRFGNKVHSWGRYRNNIKTLQTPDGEIKFDSDTSTMMRPYKFTLAFENSSRYDSFSEKVTNALRARSVPIYWGGDAIYDFVKKEAFINAKDFNSLDDLVDYIEIVNKDDALYNTYILDNPFQNSDFVKSHFIENFSLELERELESRLLCKKTILKNTMVEKVIFKISHKIYRKFWRLVMLKRRYIGGC